MSERREIGVPVAAEDYEALRRLASSRGIEIRVLLSEAVHGLVAGEPIALDRVPESREASAKALLDTELAIDWGGWDELETEILNARG